jgi:outer membrane immunogenic protein
MKKFLLATTALATLTAAPALAADMPVKAPPIAVAALYGWSGCYVGAHIGGGWGPKRWLDPAIGGFEFSSHDVRGIVGGGQAGCDMQSSNWVFGLQVSASGTGLSGDSIDVLSAGSLRDRSRVDFIGTFTGRLGVAFNNQTLLYVRGGGAVARDRFDGACTAAAVGPCTVGATFYSANSTRYGWLIGGGVEYALTARWSGLVEYNYMDFGTRRENFTGGIFAGTAPFDISQRVHVLKVGLNYRFGGPVVARY